MRRVNRAWHWSPRLRQWRLTSVKIKRLIFGIFLVLALYGFWPYGTLWSLNQALHHNDVSQLAALIDVPAIKDALRRRLNKDEVSDIGAFSEVFIAWLDAGIHTHGVQVLHQLVTLDWVRERLQFYVMADDDVLARVTTATFTGVRDFRVQLTAPAQPPLWLHLRLEAGGWRVVALYY